MTTVWSRARQPSGARPAGQARTKCLDVALRMTSQDGGTATYAGIFYPFREATYEGKVSIGQDVHDVKFTVSSAPAPQPVAMSREGELPVAGPVSFDEAITPLGALAERVPLVGAAIH